MIFDNLDIIECSYIINGIPKLSEHYTMDFSGGEWKRLFQELLKKIIANKNSVIAPLF